MIDPNPHELLGLLYCDNARLRAEYAALLGLVQRIKGGSVDPADVAILPGDSWELRAKPEGPPDVR